MICSHGHMDVVTPSGRLALRAQARLGGVGLVRTNEVHHVLLEQRQVLRCLVLA